MKDLNGRDILVGSVVAYFRGGRYYSLNICEVLEIRKKVKVKYLKSTRLHNMIGNCTWVDQERLLVIE